MGRRQGPVASVAASLSKLGVTELMFDAAVLEADLPGPHAMLQGGAASRLLVPPAGRIAGGITQLQQDLIAERLLAPPKDTAYLTADEPGGVARRHSSTTDTPERQRPSTQAGPAPQ